MRARGVRVERRAGASWRPVPPRGSQLAADRVEVGASAAPVVAEHVQLDRRRDAEQPVDRRLSLSPCGRLASGIDGAEVLDGAFAVDVASWGRTLADGRLG